MIKLGKLNIEEFRGIRELELDFNYQSFAIHGPNGSGKSGVVDAIGFVLSGSVARLTGEGTGGVSVKHHAPHVKSINDPEAARVSLTFIDTVSGQEGTITRTVKNAADFSLTPDTPELRSALEVALAHPEITLSRRELIKFILAESGKRSKEVQALLQLDKIETNRATLLTAKNKVIADKKSASANVATTKLSVEMHLEIPEANAENVKVAVNKSRVILGLDELEEIKLSTNLKEGLEDDKDEKPFDKGTATREIAAYQVKLDDTKELDAAVKKLLKTCEQIAKSEDLALIKNQAFLQTGLGLIAEEAVCPLCDKNWATPAELRKHLEKKIAGFKELSRINGEVLTDASALKELLTAERNTLKPLHTLSVTWLEASDQEIIQTRLDLLLEFELLIKDAASVFELKDRLEAGTLNHSAELKASIKALTDKIAAQPDTSDVTKARSHLILAAEKWSNYARTKAAEVAALRAADRANLAYDTYCKVADNTLEKLYVEVEDRFGEFYRQINNEDEGNFKAKFKPDGAKLELLVDFYGLGMFPPGAYHSEGHQDGMGICLYLALVEKIMGENFSLSVLDDVVMSVDVNHRKQFCELLRNAFPDTQFIITTHDEIWAKQMQTTGLIRTKSDIRFRGWSVDNGPIHDQGRVFWDKIDEHLADDDVAGAAHKLRHGLEAELPDIAEALGARIAYRGDAKYEMGDFLHAIKGRHAELLKKAAESASSWNKKDEGAKVKQLQAERVAAALTQERESWPTNLLVHQNNWMNMTPKEFKDVPKAWHEFLDLFTCSNPECETWIEVSYKDNKEETLRCRCNDLNLNLVKKS
ncbi:MAG: AAA family ATPase [Candidatus Doudnabacteria bacterium]|nr:AAA family ATPase [Candidatus Doudnabacteria bacterium]